MRIYIPQISYIYIIYVYINKHINCKCYYSNYEVHSHSFGVKLMSPPLLHQAGRKSHSLIFLGRGPGGRSPENP